MYIMRLTKKGLPLSIATMSAPINLTDRITEFFTFQGDGLKEYLNDPMGEEDSCDSFMNDLSFGTAGLRAEMGVGFNRMNGVTVGIASMGIAAYLKEAAGGGLVVIGHDHRHGSKEYAHIAGKIYKSYGHRVRLLPGVVPTPFVPSTIRCEGDVNLGVMVTASHNPKKDNGYKVYGGNGAQIGDTVAKEISGFIQRERIKYLKVKEECESIELLEDEGLLMRVSDWYNQKIKDFLNVSVIPRVRVVYTALHGVGASFVDSTFNSLYPCNVLVHVPQQRTPDPDFPTVEFPNPEEGLSTLKLAMELADAEEIKVIFANDPDADRFCVAEKQQDDEWRVFNGNEIAVLLADYLTDRTERNINCEGEKCAMLSSCVSSRFLEGFCSRRGWRHESTSTGFKNLGNRGIQVTSEGWRVLLAYEEAIGFQVGDWNFDKDGITALMTFYALLNETAGSLLERLEGVYEREGCWPVQCNGYYKGASASKIKEILSSVNEIDFSGIVNSFDKSNSCQLKLEFDIEGYGSAWLMLRPSGTEPKLKFYSELMTVERLAGAKEKLSEHVETFIKLIIKDSNELKRAS